jgi:predicted phosphoribosyltransferase/predicted alpha/beta-hydrolase family hydrolase
MMAGDERLVHVSAGETVLEGMLTVPRPARGVVLFAHGSGSSRFSRRNRAVAEVLQDEGFATLLIDLLTPAEEQDDAATGHLRFDVRMLARRVDLATAWLAREPATVELPVGYFGASTGAAAALIAAAERADVTAIVSRGGRPDLAGESLAAVRTPTLLIVGGADVPVIALNRQVMTAMQADVPRRLEIVPGATHLFAEPGALEQVAGLAVWWFRRYTRRATARFRDRRDAGRALAARLSAYAGRPDAVVLALPRGGVPVAYEVARALGAPLDAFLVRKLGAPGAPELAMGAVATGGARVVNDDVIAHLGISQGMIEAVEREERRELERRVRLYRGDRPFPDVHGRTVILVDDGLATGASMRVAVAAVRGLGPARVVVAVPVAAPEVCAAFERVADEVVCAHAPAFFQSVGQWYDDFNQTGDDEVRTLLASAANGRRAA